MAKLKGLAGLAPDPQDTFDVMDEGVLEARAHPGTPDTEHGAYGSQSDGYSGTIPTESPYSPMSVYDGFDENYSAEFGGRGYRVQGQEYDMTPTSHSSPYPRGIIQPSWGDPDAYALVGEQMTQLHGPELGGVRFNVLHDPAGREEVTHYTTDDYIAPNTNYLSPDVPGQLRAAGNNGVSASGHGNADPTQGYGVLNSLEEFNAGHSIRRVQHDHMPWDFTNTHGEQNVPFPGRHPIQQMPLNGPDSPYFEQGDIDGANIPWEARIGDPSPYVQPAETTIAPAPPSNDAYPAFAWS